MKLASLHQVITGDGILLEGLLFEPKKNKERAIGVWFQGLGSRLSSGPNRTNALAQALGRKGISFAVFDHRGAGTVTTFKKGRGGRKRYFLAGTSFEKFEHCILDIRAVIRFLRRRGYRKTFLIGHSTGANKIAFYYGKTRDRAVTGLALLGPLNDYLYQIGKLGKNYRKALGKARIMVKSNKSDELLPLVLTKGSLWSAGRFLSNARPGSNEDVFPYHDPMKKFGWTKQLKIPVLVLIGAKDQCADRPISDIIDIFRKQIPEKYFSECAIKEADHGFSGKEEKMAKAVTSWVSKSL